jgi:preprotein translocase subunit SecD
VKSGKYLSVIPGKLAKEERENVRLGLDVNGNVFSHIQLCPRYKIDKDGDRIQRNVAKALDDAKADLQRALNKERV